MQQRKFWRAHAFCIVLHRPGLTTIKQTPQLSHSSGHHWEDVYARLYIDYPSCVIHITLFAYWIWLTGYANQTEWNITIGLIFFFYTIQCIDDISPATLSCRIYHSCIVIMRAYLRHYLVMWEGLNIPSSLFAIPDKSCDMSKWICRTHVADTITNLLLQLQTVYSISMCQI